MNRLSLSLLLAALAPPLMAQTPFKEMDALLFSASPSASSSSITTADLDGDQRVDVLLAQGQQLKIFWAADTFDAVQTEQLHQSANHIASLPTDSGRDDVLIAGSTGLSRWSYDPATQTMVSSWVTTFACEAVVVSQTDHHGSRHVSVLSSDDVLHAYSAQASGSLSLISSTSTSAGGFALDQLDWENDGGQDTVVAHAGGLEIIDSAGIRIAAIPLYAPVQDLTVAADAAGRERVVGVFEHPLFGFDDWQWLLEWSHQDGAGFSSLGPLGYTELSAADFNGDGSTQLLATGPSTGAFWLHEPSGAYADSFVPTGQPTVPTSLAAGFTSGPSATALVDLDLDGDLDAVAATGHGTALAVARNDTVLRASKTILVRSCVISVVTETSKTWVLMDFDSKNLAVDGFEALSYHVTKVGETWIIDPTPKLTMETSGLFPGGWNNFVIPLGIVPPGTEVILAIRPLTNGEPAGPDTLVEFPRPAIGCAAISANATLSSDDLIDLGITVPHSPPVAAGATAPDGFTAPPDVAFADGKTEGVDPRPRIDPGPVDDPPTDTGGVGGSGGGGG